MVFQVPTTCKQSEAIIAIKHLSKTDLVKGPLRLFDSVIMHSEWRLRMHILAQIFDQKAVYPANGGWFNSKLPPVIGEVNNCSDRRLPCPVSQPSCLLPSLFNILPFGLTLRKSQHPNNTQDALRRQEAQDVV